MRAETAGITADISVYPCRFRRYLCSAVAVLCVALRSFATLRCDLAVGFTAVSLKVVMGQYGS